MKRYLAAAALLWVAALPGHADTTTMCLGTGIATEAQCECATEALAETTTPEDAAHYDAIAVRFVANRATGQDWVAAWDAAVAEVATDEGLSAAALQKAMNSVGKAHREAMKACG